MTDIVDRLYDAVEGIIALRKAHEETATKLNSYINLAGDQIDEIQKLKDVLIGISCDPSDCELGSGGCYYGDKEEHCPHKIAREAVKD